MTTDQTLPARILIACAFAALTLTTPSAFALSYDPNPIPDTYIIFGALVTEPRPFTVHCVVTPSPGESCWVTLQPLPFSVLCAYDTQEHQFYGTVPSLYIGQTIRIPFTVSEGSMPTQSIPGEFKLIVTPEPTAVGLVATYGMLVWRKRR